MTPSEQLSTSQRLRRRLLSVESAAIAGVICAVGWTLSLRGLASAPDLDADDAEIIAWYNDASNSTAAVVWLQVMVVATIAFIWFVGVVRGRFGGREPQLFGTVQFGSSILLAALMFVGSALLAAPAILVSVGDRLPDPSSAALTRSAAAVVLAVFALRVATLVMFSTASLGRATDVLPRWLILVTYAVGVVEFVNVSVSTPTIYLVPAWIGLVSIVLLATHPTVDPVEFSASAGGKRRPTGGQPRSDPFAG